MALSESLCDRKVLRLLLESDAGLRADTAAVLVGFTDLSHGHPDSIAENPGKHGWARLTLPTVDPMELAMTTLDIRTSWLTHDNPNGLKVFDRIAKRLQPLLQRPTWAWNTTNPASVTPYRNVGFTHGASDLFDQGVTWMQRGVLNIRYSPRAPELPQA